MIRIKLTIIAAVIFSFCVNRSFAQDLITKKDGTEIKAKVSEIGITKTKYKLESHTNGPLIEVLNTTLFMVKFADGTKHVYANTAGQINSIENSILVKKCMVDTCSTWMKLENMV